MYTIFIEQLSIITKIGVHDWEQNIKQKLILDVKIGFNNNHYYSINNIKHYLDYEKITKEITNYIENNKFNLVEEVAEKLVNLLINKFKILWIRIKIAKPHAIINALQAGVIIEIDNREFNKS